MPIHLEVLEAAVLICRHRGGWTFSPAEVVRALPHLKPGPVRTHVISRCCVNAPKNHPHKWDYFRRVGRGRYEILPAHRRPGRPGRAAGAEPAPAYGRSLPPTLHRTIHAVLRRTRTGYVAECLEVSVAVKGKSLGEVASDLEEAVLLHLRERGPRALGVDPSPRLLLQYEVNLPLAESARPSWKRPRVKAAVRGASLSSTILEERRQGR